MALLFGMTLRILGPLFQRLNELEPCMETLGKMHSGTLEGEIKHEALSNVWPEGQWDRDRLVALEVYAASRLRSLSFHTELLTSPKITAVRLNF